MKNNAEADPTKQSRNRQGAFKYIEGVESDIFTSVEAWVNSVPTEDGKYLLHQGAQPNQDFENAILSALLIGGTFFLNSNIEGAFRSGVFGADRDLSSSIDGFIRSGDTNNIYNFDSVLVDPEYTRTLSLYQQSAQDSIEGTAKETASRISSIVLLSMSANQPADEILSDIKNQLEIMRNKMKRTVITTVNQGLSQGTMIATGLAATALGLSGRVAHISAFLATTRPHHASRDTKISGKFYTIAEQNAWWASGANRINCYCRAKAVLTK